MSNGDKRSVIPMALHFKELQGNPAWLQLRKTAEEKIQEERLMAFKTENQDDGRPHWQKAKHYQEFLDFLDTKIINSIAKERK